MAYENGEIISYAIFLGIPGVWLLQGIIFSNEEDDSLFFRYVEFVIK